MTAGASQTAEQIVRTTTIPQPSRSQPKMDGWPVREAVELIMGATKIPVPVIHRQAAWTQSLESGCRRTVRSDQCLLSGRLRGESADSGRARDLLKIAVDVYVGMS